MGRLFRIYTPFSLCKLKTALMYKLNFVAYIIGNTFACFILYFIWKAVFNSSGAGTFAGFTLVQMIMYIFVSFVTRLMSETDASWILSEQIKDGSICMTLIKPIRLDISILFDQFGNIFTTGIFGVIFIVGVEIYNYTTTGAITSVANILLFLVSVFMAFIVNILFGLIIGYLAFFLKNLWGMNMLIIGIVNFFSGTLIPLTMFPNAVREVFQLLPFASMNFIPVMIYLGKFSPTELVFNMLLQLFWIVAFYVISRLLWRVAIKHINIQGG